MAKVFLNDRLLDESQAYIPASDSSFLYGMGLFETMRITAGSVFAFDDHFDRLAKSAQALSINNPYKKQYILDAIDSLLRANNLSDARLRLTLTNGPLSQDKKDKSTLLITAVALAGYPAEYYRRGVKVILTDYRQNPDDPTCGHKATSYAPRLLALNLAHSRGATEAIWFTPDNRLAEGSISNVFLVKNDTLYTPPLDTPVLPGVARKHVLAIAQQEKIPAAEKNLTIAELLDADEVFLTNVIMLVLPVIAVEAHTVGGGKPGPVTKKIAEKFNSLLTQTARR